MFNALLKSSCKLWTENVEDTAPTANAVRWRQRYNSRRGYINFPKIWKLPSNSRL